MFNLVSCPESAKENLQAEALLQLDKVHGGAEADDDIDSQLSEVLSELDKEDGNTQDIKEMLKKRKVQRLKRKLKSSADMDLQPKKRHKGKGKGKKKGGAKARAEKAVACS